MEKQGDEEIKEEEKTVEPEPPLSEPSPVKTSKKKIPIKLKQHTIELSARECPLSFVTVFNDRAELTREVVVNLSPGNTDISVYGISEKTDMNSIRVMGGKGTATILEVSSNISYIKETHASSPASKAQEIKLVVEKMEKEIEKLKKDLNRIIKEEEWVEGWARNLVKPMVQKNEKGAAVADVFSDESISKTESFLDFYQKRLKDIDQRREEISEKLEILNKECNIHKNELLQLPKTDPSGTPRHEVIITVHCKDTIRLELQLAYVVFGASWSASYDARVSGSSTKIEIFYYGHITNDTREDWNNTLHALSTAQPSVAGKPPDLYTKYVYCMEKYAREARKGSLLLNVAPLSSTSLYLDDIQEYGKSTSETTKATQGAISSTFNILRKATIQADNKPHKANIKNTSKDYPLLPGPMNVFMDNNFVAKSEIPLISPNESLGIYLGIDQGVKFEYQPLKHLKETQGLITITNVLNVKYQTIISNNKSKEVKVQVFDSLPKSNDSQIKVRLIDPQIVEGDENITITPANSVQWNVTIPPGDKRNISFLYCVEYPFGTEIENAF